RLKRVAADHREDVASRLPKVPSVKNGKRIACIGAGCASLTVANDLLPLGYQVTMFEQYGEPGGLMRTNIPSFRLPQPVLSEEIGMITGLGVDLRLNSPVTSLRALLAQGFDAVFVGSGAPHGKDLDLPGRDAAAANRLTGMRFERMEYELDASGRITAERVVGEEFLPADDVILAIGQENAFPWIERDLGIEFDKWDVPVIDPRTFQSTRPGVYFGGDAAFGPKNIIWAVEHGHQ